MNTPTTLNRRQLLGGLLAAPLATLAGRAEAAGRVHERTRASELRITDLRCATLTRMPMERVTVIRIDTNQGISGLGEVRDGGSARHALVLKSRLLGENPCNVDRLFRKLKQFGGHGRQGGGVSAVEVALWDLVGKAYDVPAYQLLGGKFRDRVRLYADSPEADTPKEQGRLLRERLARGFTMLKMDLGIARLANVPETLTGAGPVGLAQPSQGTLGGVELTAKGIDLLCRRVAEAREAIGGNVPLALDHFGPLSVKSCIRLGKALEKYAPAWLEDMIPWTQTEQLRQIRQAVDVPILTGEDVYLKEGFRPLLDARAVDLIHPDLTTAGGMLETKKIGDLAQEAGIGMVLHFGGSPIGFMASVHAAAATENFLALEFHSADVPFWESLVRARHGPLIRNGWATVPDAPGLGVTLNEKVFREHLHRQSGYFEPTRAWDELDNHDPTWS